LNSQVSYLMIFIDEETITEIVHNAGRLLAHLWSFRLSFLNMAGPKLRVAIAGLGRMGLYPPN
jgi:hypothetical protein